MYLLKNENKKIFLHSNGKEYNNAENVIKSRLESDLNWTRPSLTLIDNSALELEETILGKYNK